MFKKILISAAFVLPLFFAGTALALPLVTQNHIPVCPGPVAPGTTRCNSQVVVNSKGQPNAGTLPSGYGPSQFLTGYNLTGSAPGSATIAIVDAYDQPNIKSDLDTYNKTYGLPAFPSCGGSVNTSCFQKVDQRGGTSYPRADAGWGLEISLDVEIAHAVCQNCKILLVEADSNSFANLLSAVDTARNLGANVISNSYGGSEFSGQTSYDSHFNIPGVAVTVSSGDSGYGVEYPAASQYVTAVGGTTLNLSGNTYVSESAWNGSGSGCSGYDPKPAWQHDTGCLMRTVADVSADANPNTGAAVYDSLRYQGRKGWYQVGGTSLSSPLVAAVYALSGNYDLSHVYGSASNLHDVTTGSNGTCGGSYLCTAKSGYDGPTGLGTPNGPPAF